MSIYEIRNVSMIPLFHGDASAAAKRYIEGIASIFSHGSFYYSWDTDMSKQLLGDSPIGDSYRWNNHMM